MSRPAVVVLWGEDPFLLREAAFDVLEGVQPVEIDAAEWQGGETSDLSTPSLFGERRALLVNDCRSLPDHALAELKGYCATPSPDALLVLLARVGERGKAPAALLKLVEGVGEVREANVARRDLPAWIGARAKRRGVQFAPGAAQTLVEILGENPATLDQALEQLASAFPGGKVTRELVASQFRGLGEQRVWDLCDRAFGRDLPGSVRSLQSLLGAREDPLMILGGIASRLRDLLRVKELPERLPPAELAREAGLRFEWQARRYREQALRFSMEELVAIHDRLVEADRGLKSGAGGEVVLAQLVTAVANG